MDEDSNIARKAYSRRLESLAAGTRRKVEEVFVISFGSTYLKRVTTLHEDTLAIQDTISNYEVAQVFVDSWSSVNILISGLHFEVSLD